MYDILFSVVGPTSISNSFTCQVEDCVCIFHGPGFDLSDQGIPHCGLYPGVAGTAATQPPNLVSPTEQQFCHPPTDHAATASDDYFVLFHVSVHFLVQWSKC